MDLLVSLSLSLLAFIVAIINVFHEITNKSDNDKTDMFGKKYRRLYYRPGRICPECGFRAITQIPTCPSCKTKFLKDRINKIAHPYFSQDSEGKKIHHRHL